MRSISRIALTNAGFAALLAIFIGLVLFAVGFGPDTLPFPVQSHYSDAVVSHWPNTLYFQQSIQRGVLPLWRCLLMSGQPFAANPLNKVWYPLQWLALLLPATVHVNLLIWLHLVLAGLGMRALGRRLGVQPSTANIMALAYALGPRLWVGTGAGHLDIVYASAWIPWVLWAVHTAIIENAPIERRIALLSMICAFSFLADIRTSVFCFGAGAAYAVWLLLSRRSVPNLSTQHSSGLGSPSPQTERGSGGEVKPALLILLASALVTIGLTAVQWLPLLQLAPYLSRYGLTPTDAGAYSLSPNYIIGLIVPERFGFQETLTYTGITVFILALIALIRFPRRHLFWLGLIFFSVLYAFGNQGPLWPILIRLLPVLLWLRVPARAWIIVVVALIVLAGSGIDALADQRVRRRVLPVIGIVLLGLGVAWAVVAAKAALPPGAGIATLIGFLAMGALFLAIRRLPKMWIVPLLGSLIALDLVWMDVSLVHGVPHTIWLDTYAPLAQALHEAGVTRIYSPDYSLPQQAAAYWNIPEFGGIDPFQSTSYVKAFESATGTRANGYTVTLPPYDNDDPHLANRTALVDPQKLARWNVSHVLTSFALTLPDLLLVQRIDNLYLYKNTVLSADMNINGDTGELVRVGNFRIPPTPRLQASDNPSPVKRDGLPDQISLPLFTGGRGQGEGGGTNTIVSWTGPNSFTATNNGTMPANVAAWMPGWNVAPENHDDTAIVVQPGQTLTASYDAPGLAAGLTITALSTALTLGAVVVGSVRRG